MIPPVSTARSPPHTGMLRRLGVLPRALVVVVVLAVETLLISGLIQDPGLDGLTGWPRRVHEAQHWLFRYLIAYAGCCALLIYLRGAVFERLAGLACDAPLRVRFVLLHLVLLPVFAWLSGILYRDLASSIAPFAVRAIAWHLTALLAALALWSACAPRTTWWRAICQLGSLPVFALLPAAGALLVYEASQRLWQPAAALTFQMVQLLVRPFCRTLRTDAHSLTLMTDRFAVEVSPVCSGLEGVGLMLVFCSAWLWYFRREYRFPRALVILPIGVAVVFALNAVRIAALVLIGSAGHQKIASVGFHSQAGWIAFNLAAFGMAYAAKHSRWISRGRSATDAAPADAANAADAAAGDATTAYLMPLLAVLAAGMLVHAMSSGFDVLYVLRPLAALTALYAFRRTYRVLDWRFGWRGIGTGCVVFAVWSGCAQLLVPQAAMPADLAALPLPLRILWIASRAMAAVVTVPVVEELAYRGFLMRRLVSADFTAVPFAAVRAAALLASAVVFGITHAAFWLPGIFAGIAYGGVAVRTGKIGESVAAHATTNALVALQVLLFGQWQLW